MVAKTVFLQFLNLFIGYLLLRSQAGVDIVFALCRKNQHCSSFTCHCLLLAFTHDLCYWLTGYLSEHIDVLEEKLRPETVMTFSEIIPISAKKKHQTDRLKSRLRSLLDFYADLEKEEDQKYIKQQQRKRQENEKLLHEFSNFDIT